MVIGIGHLQPIVALVAGIAMAYPAPAQFHCRGLPDHRRCDRSWTNQRRRLSGACIAVPEGGFKGHRLAPAFLTYG